MIFFTGALWYIDHLALTDILNIKIYLGCSIKSKKFDQQNHAKKSPFLHNVKYHTDNDRQLQPIVWGYGGVTHIHPTSSKQSY